MINAALNSYYGYVKWAMLAPIGSLARRKVQFEPLQFMKYDICSKNKESVTAGTSSDLDIFYTPLMMKKRDGFIFII